MPLFEYQCRECARQFETLVRGSEPVECPQCGSRTLEKLFSTTAAHVRQGGQLPIASGCPISSGQPCDPSRCGMQ